MQEPARGEAVAQPPDQPIGELALLRPNRGGVPLVGPGGSVERHEVGLELDQVALAEPRREAEIPQRLAERPRRVAAGPAPLLQRRLRRLTPGSMRIT